MIVLVKFESNPKAFEYFPVSLYVYSDIRLTCNCSLNKNV